MVADSIERGRMTAGHEGPIVVFVIGMRINRLVRITRWWPAFRAMGRMLGELGADPDSGFLGGEAMFRSWRIPGVDPILIAARNRNVADAQSRFISDAH